MSQMFQQKPILGWGYETLDQNIGHFYRQVGEASLTRHVVTSHNTYMTVLTELGLIGLVLYMFPVIWWLILTFKVWPRMPKEGLWSRQLIAGLWLVMLFIFTVSNAIDMRFFQFGLALWWMILGLIANMVYPYLKGRSIEEPSLVRVG
jgi:O-antigen ligase